LIKANFELSSKLFILPNFLSESEFIYPNVIGIRRKQDCEMPVFCHGKDKFQSESTQA